MFGPCFEWRGGCLVLVLNGERVFGPCFELGGGCLVIVLYGEEGVWSLF